MCARACLQGARAQNNLALSQWIWSCGILPLGTTLLWLAERLAEGVSIYADVGVTLIKTEAGLDATHHHLDYLLVKDTNLSERLDWLQEAGHNPSFWNEDSPMAKEDAFRQKFLSSGTPQASTSMSAMSLAERLVPTLDLVFACLLEASAGASKAQGAQGLEFWAKIDTTLRDFVEKVMPLVYQYHAGPVRWLLGLFSTYYRCAPAAPVRSPSRA